MKKNKSTKVSKKAIGPFADKPIALPEGIDMEDHVIATYWIQADKGWDMAVMGQVLAIEQTTGTWVPVPGETPEIRAGHVAKVIGVYEAPNYEYAVPPEVTSRQYILQIAFPGSQRRRSAAHDADRDHRQYFHGAQFQTAGYQNSQSHFGPV